MVVMKGRTVTGGHAGAGKGRCGGSGSFLSDQSEPSFKKVPDERVCVAGRAPAIAASPTGAESLPAAPVAVAVLMLAPVTPAAPGAQQPLVLSPALPCSSVAPTARANVREGAKRAAAALAGQVSCLRPAAALPPIHI